MSWNIEQTLHLDLSQKGSAVLLEKTETGVSDRTRELAFRLADCFTLKLFFIDRATAEAIVPLPAGFQIVLAGKLSVGGVISGSVLFSAMPFTEFDVDGDKGYSATLDLNTSELATEMDGEASIDVQIDVEIQNADNSRRITLSFVAKIKPQSYAGEGSPTPAEPLYPAPSVLLTTANIELPAGKKLVFSVDGTFALENTP